MSLTAWILVLISQLALVAGQIFLKRAMARRELGDERARGWIGQLVIGIVTMTVWFLLWLGVMARVDLSQAHAAGGHQPAAHRGGRDDLPGRAAELARLGAASR